MNREQVKELLYAIYRLTYHNRTFRTWTESVRVIETDEGYGIAFMVDGIYFDAELAHHVAEDFWQPFIDGVTSQIHSLGSKNVLNYEPNTGL